MVLALIFGLLGLIFGSFIAAVTIRMPRDEDIVLAPSRCMSCGLTLRPWHLIPVFSWLIQRGKCAKCGATVSPRYILIECAAGTIGVWAALAGDGDLIWTVATAVLGWQLLLLALIDAENFWLPDELTLPLIASGLIASAVIGSGWPVDQIIGAVTGFSGLWLVALAYRTLRRRNGMGAGDPILFAGVGAWVGWQGLPTALLWACAAGFSLVLTFLITRRKVSATDRLPFGTLLAIGLWLTWLWGPISG
ncbi:peptidase A24 [Brevundimonas sp. AAP58]|uniref:prepilin peptidase n=1 Tax=Brevundimonas sp. AAP58 TaxID=1523422 RepID=UPI0006B897E6|nr:A24 family peptidase [Brevundimonas sp. AAP58]KPF78984.1 peptidase A24 [Brevundimonas sp. AAP58]